MCFQFQDLEVQDFFNELNEEMKKDQSTFFQNCFRESLQVGYTKDQKEFIVQGLLNSPKHLMQLYFTFLLHDYLFVNEDLQIMNESKNESKKEKKYKEKNSKKNNILEKNNKQNIILKNNVKYVKRKHKVIIW
jgi:hypothetical protein